MAEASRPPRSPRSRPPDPAWKGILDLCDEIGTLKRRLAEGRGSRETLSRLREESHHRAAELRTRLRRDGGGLFREIAERHRLMEEDLSVLAHLLARFLAPGRGDVAGRELLDLLADSTFEKLRLLPLLRAEGTLRRARLVVSTTWPKGGNDPLDVSLRLSDRLARRFTGAPGRPSRGRGFPRGAYRCEHDHLLDLRDLAALYRERATLLFQPRPPDAVDEEGDLSSARRRIEQAWKAIERRVRATPRFEEFPFEKFRKEYALEDDEVLVVVALLFQEAFDGEPYLTAVDLLKMVSDCEEEVLEKRRLLARDGRLVKTGIVVLEDPIAEKDLTAEACLGNWVVDRILGASAAEEGIPADERIDFHLYLRNLDSSSRFFRDLRRRGGGGGAPSRS